jgi:hypothetical protein
VAYAGAGDAAVARHLGCERIHPQRAADGARGRAQRARHGGVGRHAPGGDLLEERVDALLEGGDVGGGHFQRREVVLRIFVCRVK